MYNLDRIAGAVKDIEDYFKKLELFKKGREIIKENEDVQAFHASAMMCLSIINRAIDLATDIIVQKEISMPTRYKEIFSLMAKEGILSKEAHIFLFFSGIFKSPDVWVSVCPVFSVCVNPVPSQKFVCSRIFCGGTA